MKTLITLFTITSAFFLMSCSNVDQDLSPVGPEIEKISIPDVTGTYPYLTSFTSIDVDGFSGSPAGNIPVADSAHYPHSISAKSEHSPGYRDPYSG